MQFIKEIIRNLAKEKGFQVSKYTSEESLVDFFKNIFPITTEHKLIRIGGDEDGGYLVPDDLQNIKYCFSPGVSNVADFEIELTKRGIRCFLADNSVEGPPVANELFDFGKKVSGSY